MKKKTDEADHFEGLPFCRRVIFRTFVRPPERPLERDVCQDHRKTAFSDARPNKLLAIRQSGSSRRYIDPVLEYLDAGNEIYPIRVRTFDTNLAFGHASLDSHARMFRGTKKLPSITQDDKEQMKRTFASKPVEAFLYACHDPILTLCVEEQMHAEDRRIYLSLGFDSEEIPPLRPKVPIDLETICLKAMEKDPDRRYQTAGQMADDLRRFVNRFAIHARRAGPVEKQEVSDGDSHDTTETVT
jgi:hypothetical protein